MLRPIRYAWLAFGFALSISAYPQSDVAPLGLEPGEHAVGFRLIEQRDASRMVTGGVTAKPQARPLRVYLWYPARRAGRPVTFGRYAALADDDVWPREIAGPLREKLQYARRPLARSLRPEDYRALLQRPMRAAENAEAASGPFALIALGQGLYYESPAAFAALGEYLASHGFVVATTPLVGTNSPLIKLDVEDLETQLRDLELVIAHARTLPFVDGERLGVLGFDMGGMVGVLLAMRNRDVDAFASLDSGILFEHPSGLPRRAPGYDASALRAPWLHATPPRSVRPPSASSESLFDTAIHAERYLLVTEGMGHVDFTSYALIEGRRDIPGYTQEPGATAGLEGHRAVAGHVLSFFSAYLADDAASLTLLSRSPLPRMTLEHRGAAPPSIGYDEFVAEVVAGRGDDAVARLRAAAATDPDHILLGRTYLERLADYLLLTSALAAEALPVIELLNDMYPESLWGRYLFAEAHAANGDYAEAIAAYERLVAELPDDARARARLESLRGSPRD